MSDWPGGGEEFDLDRLPGNPRMCETVKEFLIRQRRFVSRTKWPPGTRFECKGCGDCCTWNFIILNLDKDLAKELQKRVKHPHGSWYLMEEKGQIRVQMPNFSFIGNIPPEHMEFIVRTGRRWGYWVLNVREKVVLYNPTPCIHLTEDKRCAIYEERPHVCQIGSCRRWPIIP